jgi:hypothetical protein
VNSSGVAKTLRFTVETGFGAAGPRMFAMLQIAHTPSALKGDSFHGEYVEKLLRERQLKNSQRKLLDQQ